MPPSKRGLAWPVENTDPVFPFTKPGSKISWLYNWSTTPTPGAASLAFIPMQWNAVGAPDLPSKLNSTSTLLAFNEPELPDQANMPAALAAQTWLQHIQPLRASREGFRAGSPAISSAPHAVPWLLDFLARIRAAGSDVDFYCLHWYGASLGAFYDHIWSAYYQLGADKPAWITEFAATNWDAARPLGAAEVEGFARESWKYLDGLEWVERYAWFGAMRDCGAVGGGAALIAGDGGLTALGRAYRDG